MTKSPLRILRRSRPLAWGRTIALAFLLTACATPTTEPSVPSVDVTPASDTGQPAPTLTAATGSITDAAGATTGVGIANPASVHCERSGGRLEIRTNATGAQQGICVFPDGSECEEWALYHGDCQPASGPVPPPEGAGDQTGEALPGPGARYENAAYGFRLDAPPGWAIEEQANHVIFRTDDYFLFVGFKRFDETVEPFRTGMPGGSFEPGGSVPFLGQDLPKLRLVDEGRTKVVQYASGVGIGDLRLSVWLDAEGVTGDWRLLDIADEIEEQADAVVASFALLSGETPTLELSPDAGG